MTCLGFPFVNLSRESHRLCRSLLFLSLTFDHSISHSVIMLVFSVEIRSSWIPTNTPPQEFLCRFYRFWNFLGTLQNIWWHLFWSVCQVVSLLAMILFHRWCQAWCNLYMLLIQLFLSTTLLQLTVIIHKLLFGGIFSTLDDVDSVLCMVLVFELVLTPLFLFGMFGLNTDVLMSLSCYIGPWKWRKHVRCIQLKTMICKRVYIHGFTFAAHPLYVWSL
jgi:hypothetical protein